MHYAVISPSSLDWGMSSDEHSVQHSVHSCGSQLHGNKAAWFLQHRGEEPSRLHVLHARRSSLWWTVFTKLSHHNFVVLLWLAHTSSTMMRWENESSPSSIHWSISSTSILMGRNFCGYFLPLNILSTLPNVPARISFIRLPAMMTTVAWMQFRNMCTPPSTGNTDLT